MITQISMKYRRKNFFFKERERGKNCWIILEIIIAHSLKDRWIKDAFMKVINNTVYNEPW